MRFTTMTSTVACAVLLSACGSTATQTTTSTTATAGGASSATASTSSTAASTTTTAATSTAAAATSTEAGVETIGALLAKAETAVKAAKSTSVKGWIGQGSARQTIDLSGAVDGSNQRLQIVSAGTQAEVLTVDDVVYIKGNPAFWLSTGAKSAEAKKISAGYVKMPASQVAGDLGRVTIKALIDELFSDTPMGALASSTTKISPTTVDGRQVFVIKDPSDGSSATIAAEAPYRLVSIDGSTKEPGHMEFAQWDAAPKAVAPAAAQILNR